MENPTSIIRVHTGEKFTIESRELISLRDECFPEMLGTEKEPLDYWLWKHGVDNEGVSSRYLVAVIEPGSRPVGFYAARKLRYHTPHGPTEVGLVCDVMTSPSFQGRGIFVRLGAEAVKGFLTSDLDSLTGYPIRKNVLPGHRKVGWSFTDRLPVYIALGSQNYWRYRSLRAKTTKFTVSACAPIDILSTVGFASFYEEWKLKAELQEWSYLDLSNEFVKWRYSAPGVNYIATVAKDREGKIVGFAIGRRMKIGSFYFLVIGDIRETEKTVVPLMLSNLRSQTEKVIGIAGMFSRAASRDLRLKRFGFIPTFKKFWLIQFTRMMLELSVNSDTTLTNPYLTWSDTDDI